MGLNYKGWLCVGTNKNTTMEWNIDLRKPPWSSWSSTKCWQISTVIYSKDKGFQNQEPRSSSMHQWNLLHKTSLTLTISVLEFLILVIDGLGYSSCFDGLVNRISTYIHITFAWSVLYSTSQTTLLEHLLVQVRTTKQSLEDHFESHMSKIF